MGHPRVVPALVLSGALAATAVACRSVAPALGPDPAAARATADGLFGGIAIRFDRVFRDERVKTARRLIAKSTLVPSRIFGDTAAWLSRGSDVRATGWRGTAEGARYHIMLDTSHSPLAHAGDSRQLRHLARTGDDSYEWRHDAEFAAGNATPAALAGIPSAWFAAGERADSAAVRADMHDAFPRSTRAFGQLFSLASRRATRDAAGAWLQELTIVMHTERAKGAYPAFAKWLHDYISPARGHVRLHDGARTWFDMTMRNDSIVMRFRSEHGALLPLEGGAMHLPDSLTFEMDASAKFSIFRVGFRGLAGQATVIRSATERGWNIRFTKEPDWQLPLLAEQMLHTPLRHPFEGKGSSYRVAARRDASAPQTLLVRAVVLPVQESAILRFITKISGSSVGEFVDAADRDMNLWLTTAFTALRDDARQVLAETHTPSR